MKIAVISDTHNNVRNIEKNLSAFNACDYLVHLGDGVNDLNSFLSVLKCQVIRVRGNCDFSVLPKEHILDVDGIKVLLTHGDLYHVKTDYINLAYAAMEKDCTHAFFGHTHCPIETNILGVELLNPGSLGGKGVYKPSYAVFEGKEGKFFSNFVLF